MFGPGRGKGGWSQPSINFKPVYTSQPKSNSNAATTTPTVTSDHSVQNASSVLQVDNDLSSTQNPRKPIIIPIDEGEIVYYPDFLSKEKADHLLTTLLDTVPWAQHKVRVGDGWYEQPRLVSWMSKDPSFKYTYSGLTLTPTPPVAELIELQQQVEIETHESEYDGTLLNLYRNGKDSIAPHSDDETTLQPESTIASISLGVTRKFILKHKRRKDLKPIEIDLRHGSLLLMKGKCQKNYLHEVPKEPKLCLKHYGKGDYGNCDCTTTKRINLTMRHYKR